jgi:membrane fusion protein, multidrug efflux system
VLAIDRGSQMADVEVGCKMRRTVHWMVGIGAVGALGAGGYAWVAGGDVARSAPPPVAAQPLPVTSGEVVVEDFPIYRLGVGTVQAFNTVTVRVRVDGEIQRIAFHEGQDVGQGDLLANVDPRLFQAALDQAKARKMQDEAQLISARKDLYRSRTLVDKSFQTQQVVDQQQAKVDQLIASISADEAAIESAQTNLGYTTIVAPISGRTGVRLIDQGNMVHATDATGLVVITQINPIAVIFTLPQQFFPEIVDALHRGPVAVLAYDQDNRLQLGEGRLELIDNRIDQGIGSVRLKAIFPNEDERLWPGTFVNAWLRVAVRRGTVVPTSAVQAGPDGSLVFLIRPDNTVEMRRVRVSTNWQGMALIESGLAAQDRVVIEGHYRLRQGARVTDMTSKNGTSGKTIARQLEASSQ